MPSYRGHLLGGLATFVVLAQFPVIHKITGSTTLLTLICGLSSCLLGSLFPDIDTKSRSRRYFFYALAIGIAVALSHKLFSLALFFALMGIFPLFTPHRQLTHHPAFLIAIPFVVMKIIKPSAPWLAALPIGYYLFFVAGALSHVALDFLPYRLFGVRFKQKQRGAR